MNHAVARTDRGAANEVVDAAEYPPDPFAQGARIGRAGAWTIALLFGSVALWLGLAPLNGAVVMPAQVKIENYRKSVQHLEGGIVRAVFVNSGDRVKAGQALLQLEEVQADAAVAGLQDQLDGERARSVRADHERAARGRPEHDRSGRVALAFPDELLARAAGSAKLRSLLSAESQLYAARREQLDGQTLLLRDQAERVRAELVGLQEQIDAANANRTLIAAELTMNQELFRQAFVQQTRVMGLQRTLADKDEKRGEFTAELARAQQKLVEIELKLISLKDDHLKRASDEYTDANRRMLDLQERLRPLAQQLTRQQVVAPVAGEVVDLRVHTVGGVIGPREVLMEIVPERHTLLVEGKLRPEDVADIAIGQRVEVQITAFKQRSTPLLEGRLSYISADSLSETVNGAAVAHFLVQVTLAESAQATLPARLSPGMPATVFIQTQARTGLDYLLQPLTDSMRRAFREH